VKKLLAEDISRVQVQTDEASVEWLLTSKFEFFEQLEKLRATREAARREAQAAEEKLKLPGLPVTRVGEGDLNNLFSNPTVIRKVARILGIPESQTERGGFLCVLHKEQHPSAHLFQDNRGRFIYTCFHRSGRRVRPLPEVYYVQKTDNTDEQLKGPTFAVWALRLLAEAGVLQPLDDVGFPPLEGNVTDGLRKVYDGLRLLFSLRWTYSAGEAAPVSWRFAAEWCGVSQATAGKAMHELLRLGVIHAAGKHKNITLFLPGRGKRVVRIRFVGRKSEHAGRHSAE
jgi:CRP-like cAMP-binding protein